jgi:hypothetical protein
MSTKVSDLVPINCLPGVQPTTDKTALATQHWTLSDKIRFVNGFPRKIKGWVSIALTSVAGIQGVARTLFSSLINGIVQTVIGTNTYLYSLRGSSLVNVSPLVTATTAAANSLATHYGTLANNPITTTSGSAIITVADADAGRYAAGDLVTFSGSAAVGGILAATINTEHSIRAVAAGSYTVQVGTTATSTATGGGAAVVRKDGLIRVTSVAHEMLDGYRVKINAAAATGGVLAAEINVEHIIRNVSANTFDVMTDGTATSSVSAAGGAATTFQPQLDEGARDESFGQGYGMGLYGVGLYGVPKTSNNAKRYPRIWFCDKFGAKVVLTPGNQGGVYQWGGDISVAPALISGAPSAVNYLFVSDSILVTFGAGNIENKVFSSDQGNYSQWTASSTNQVFEDEIEGAGRLIGHIPVQGSNLIFTENQTRTFRYIGLPNIWEIKMLDPAIGMIAPMAGICVNNIAFWMGERNFYMWDGASVKIMPSNSDPQCTLLEYIFTNFNISQKSKVYCWYNSDYNEIWWHYPSASSLDPDMVVRVCIDDFTWMPDTFLRTCAERPNALLGYPRLIYTDSEDEGTLYRHETGDDADGTAITWSLKTNLRNNFGKDTTTEVALIPDNIQIGAINVQVNGYQWPQSTAKTSDNTYTFSPSSDRVPILANGRYTQYILGGSEIGQSWQMGAWHEQIQRGGSN